MENVRFAGLSPVGSIIEAVPVSRFPGFPGFSGFSWYGIHPVELLYSEMGPGCKSVARSYHEGWDVITGEWADGRLGVVRTIREGKNDYGVVAFAASEIKVSTDAGGAYGPLVGNIVEFFKTGKPPVPNDVTLEIFAFMDAAQRSKQQGGAKVELQ